jgi:hypothetical protein
MLQTLQRKPELFQALTGLTLAAFHRLHDNIEPHWRKHEARTKRQGCRRRAAGAGRKHGLPFVERLLIACLCERQLLPTSEIATLYGIHPSTVNRYQQSLRPFLQQVEAYPAASRLPLRRGEVTQRYPALLELWPALAT